MGTTKWIRRQEKQQLAKLINKKRSTTYSMGYMYGMDGSEFRNHATRT